MRVELSCKLISEGLLGLNVASVKYRCLSQSAFFKQLEQSQCGDICPFHVAAASSHQEYATVLLKLLYHCLLTSCAP